MPQTVTNTLIEAKNKLKIGFSYKVHPPDDKFPTAATDGRQKRNIQSYPTADIPQLIRCVAGIPY